MAIGLQVFQQKVLFPKRDIFYNARTGGTAVTPTQGLACCFKDEIFDVMAVRPDQIAIPSLRSSFKYS